MATTEINDKYLVPALYRGIELLGQFTRESRELGGAELARRLDLPRASVFRMLYTLEKAGFLERVGDTGNYRLGIGLLRLGFEYLASMELTEIGTPIIEELRDSTGFSAHLVVRDGAFVVFVAKAAGRNALFHSIQVGARLPAYATALGRLLLGGLDLPELYSLYPEAPLPSFTPKTPKTVPELKQLIDTDRLNGYALSEGGYETGISTVAAPVFNGHQEVIAAINITVPGQTMPPEQTNVLIPKVQHAAKQLTNRIGHLPPRKS